MTKGIIKIAMIIMLFCCIKSSLIFADEASFKEHLLLSGNWGNGDGEFGKEILGKTETGFNLDFKIYKQNIYIFDPINNRIQIFDLNGNFIKKIALDFDWLKQGITWKFVILSGNYFALIAKPPSYSVENINQIYKISPSGKILKTFGSKQINTKKEEYFSKILANDKTGEIYCYIEDSSRIAVYDFEGKFVKYISTEKNPNQMIIDNYGRIVRNAPNYCRWMDRKGNCYKIWSTSSAKTNFVLTTKIQIFPPNSKTEDIITHELSGDVKFVKEGKEQIIRYRGNFNERSFVDADGNIYHMIALDDGVVLRRIVWKSGD